MESVWNNSTISVYKKVGFWTWVARIIPLLYIPISLYFTYFELNDLLDYLNLSLLIISPTIAIIWWWWAMDTMKWLSVMHVDALSKQEDIMEELRALKEDLIFNGTNNRKRRKSKKH